MLIAGLKKTTIRFTATPAIYGFDVLTNLSREEIEKNGYPENISRWGWHSAHELLQSVEAFYKRCLTGHYVNDKEMDVLETYRFKLVNFTKLNQQLADNDCLGLRDSFTWFIDEGPGHLFLGRPGSTCPFNDPALHVPAQWGLNVLKAVRQGFHAIEIQNGRLKGVLPDGERRSALSILG